LGGITVNPYCRDEFGVQGIFIGGYMGFIIHYYIFIPASSKGCPKRTPYRKTQEAPLRISDFEFSKNVVETFGRSWKYGPTG